MTDAVDRHLAGFPDRQRKALESTRATVHRALPAAEETISYGMPTFTIGGVAVLGFDGFTHHNSLFPYSGRVVSLVRAELPDYPTSKGTIQFPPEAAFPAGLLRTILRQRLAEINDSFPKKSGEMKQFFANGALKVTGRVRDGREQGPWRWYRSDGSLLRCGTFRRGERVGAWTTYGPDGEPTATTTY